MIPEGSHGVFFGASMSLKSFIAMEMAHCVCSGRSFMDHPVREIGKVLYLCAEGMGDLNMRLRAVIMEKGDFSPSRISILDRRLIIDDKDEMAKLMLDITDLNPSLVFIDTFSASTNTASENDSTEVSEVLNNVRDACLGNKRTSTIIIHHTGKDATKGARGSGVFLNNTDFVFEACRAKEGELYVGTTVLYCRKMKCAKDFDPISMNARLVELGVDAYGDKLSSLVLEKGLLNNDVSNYAIKKEVKLTLLQDEFMIVARQVSNVFGQPPTTEIIARYPDSPKNIPLKVIHEDDLKREVFKILNCESNKKSTRFQERVNSLMKIGKLFFYNGYYWLD